MCLGSLAMLSNVRYAQACNVMLSLCQHLLLRKTWLLI